MAEVLREKISRLKPQTQGDTLTLSFSLGQPLAQNAMTQMIFYHMQRIASIRLKTWVAITL